MSKTLTIDRRSDQARRATLGQFFTPPHIADVMVSWIDPLPETIYLLDAGAGTGSLIAALARRVCREQGVTRKIHVTAFEIDPELAQPLAGCIAECQRMCDAAGVFLTADIHHTDFLSVAVPAIRRELFAETLPPFNIALVNPPYRKIRSDSTYRLLLRSVGIETSNLYAGFLALIIRLLAPGGQLVSITPRSFCNGPYFRPFRNDLLGAMAIRRLHVFESRSAVFHHDDVLQETVMMHATKSTQPHPTIWISRSSGAVGHTIHEQPLPRETIIRATGDDQWIHIPEHEEVLWAHERIQQLPATLADLGLAVSTGRVVDFRAKPFLRDEPNEETVPLIYPHHFQEGAIRWPKAGIRKPQAIRRCAETAHLLIPSEVYVVIKRFTAKEERRRLVAALYEPSRIPCDMVGFENHVNYIHAFGRGLNLALARGLTLFLNSTWADRAFRAWSGHTQVNAADLRAFSYPSRAALEEVGAKTTNLNLLQAEIDALIEEILYG
ncbi:Eco57I restriction-modification methylase domain-containing protein [Chloroflexus sp.]|uniref:Eco57I restriction-modification methylase domain-containing protein n=1 Tax=Chloroflexus sp. TaxID=1904827 RepID=UPI002ACE87F9|nr:N-6 DNA methylase [Chloroflexus sp.]